MTFENKQEFYASMFALNENKQWGLIASSLSLNTRFLQQALEVNRYKTIHFKKIWWVLLFWLLLVVIIINLLAKSSLSFEGTMCISIGLVSLLLYRIASWVPNYKLEAFYQKKEFGKMIAIDLESEKNKINNKIEELKKWRQTILEIESIDVIKSTILGSNVNNNSHFIYYMQDESIVKYWNEVERVRILTEETKEHNNLTAYAEQLWMEIQFCQNIQ